jgi:uncharacterized membrane protein YeiB
MHQDTGTIIVQDKSKTTKRSLAPDLARGFMLLLIALAHAPMYVASSGSGVLNHPLGGSWIDNTFKFLTLLFIDLRSYPMFAALFGFGLAMIVSRRLATGSSLDQTKLLVYRRCFFLIVFGVLHAVFIFSYDILSIYGIAGLIVGWLLFRSDRAIVKGAAWFVGFVVFMLTVQAVMMAVSGEQASAPHGSVATDMYGTSILIRFTEFPMWIVYSLLVMPLLAPILIGVWVKRKELLEKPEQNKSILKYITIVGISVSVIGGLPFALAGAQVWQPAPDLKGVLIGIHTITGLFGGIGYTAMFGLISLYIGQHQGVIVQSLVAIGRRSLTCYLAQSIILAILLSDWGLDIGDKIHSFTAALIAIVVWLLTVFLAVFLEHRGNKGPAETLLQRLIYKKNTV